MEQYPEQTDWENSCRKCKSRLIDRSENDNSILCRECREEQIRYPFPKLMIPAAILLGVILIFAIIQTRRPFHYYKIYAQAERQSDNGEAGAALMEMLEVMEQYPNSVTVAEKMVDLSMQHGYYDFAAYVLNTYMIGVEVSSDTYSKLTSYSNKLNRYYDLQDKIEEISAGISMEGDEARDQIKSQLLVLVDDRGYDQGLLNFYLGLISQDPQEAIQYLEKSVNADPKVMAYRVYYGNSCRRAGDLAKARACYEYALTQEKHNTGAMRAMGILDLLEGEKEQGLVLIQQAFEENPEEDYIRETLIIALAECGQTEEANAQKQKFDEEGVEFDEDFLNYLQGNTSLYDYYVTP